MRLLQPLLRIVVLLPLVISLLLPDQHVSATSSVAAAASVVLSIERIPTFGGGIPYAEDINDAGQVTGGVHFQDGNNHAFIYSHGVITDIGTFGGPSSYASGINQAGVVVYNTSIATDDSHIALYQDGIISDLGILGYTPGQNVYSVGASGINNKGALMGTINFRDSITSTVYQHAFVYNNNTFHDLGTLSSYTRASSFPYAINDAGYIVGTTATDTGYSYGRGAFVYDGTSMKLLTSLGTIESGAYGINNAGQIVGEYTGNNLTHTAHGFLYQNGIVQDLVLTPGGYSAAYDINDLGAVVGSADNGLEEVAFLYRDNHMLDLNTILPANSGWQLTQADRINNVGQIIGTGIYQGTPTSFLLTLAPIASVTGKVLNLQNAPLAGTTITNNFLETKVTNANGEFTFTSAYTKTLTLTPSKDNYLFTPRARTVTIPPDATGQNFTGTLLMILPAFPQNVQEHSTVMRGGTVYRHFELRDEAGATYPDATIYFSVGPPATVDASGAFTYTNAEISKITPGSYAIQVVSMTVGSQIVHIDQPQTHFTVDVAGRKFTNIWSFGAARKIQGGINEGVISYILNKNNGGLELVLDETDPDSSDDDHVSMKQIHGVDFGAGMGIGKTYEVELFSIKALYGAKGVLELVGRVFGKETAYFSAPYSDPSQMKAESAYLLISIIDSLEKTSDDQPLMYELLKYALDSSPTYSPYIIENTVGLGIKGSATADAGAYVNIGLKRQGVSTSNTNIGAQLFAGSASATAQIMKTDYRQRNEQGMALEAEINLDISGGNVVSPLLKQKGPTYVGYVAGKIRVEAIEDLSTQNLKRVEVTLSGGGNPATFNDINKDEIRLKVTIGADQLTPEVRAQIQDLTTLIAAMHDSGTTTNILTVSSTNLLNDLNRLLAPFPYLTYEVVSADKQAETFETGIAVTADVNIAFGGALDLKHTREFVRERGAFIYGHGYVTETYTADTYVSRPGKTWQELSATILLQGIWQYYEQHFNIINTLIRSSGPGGDIVIAGEVANGIVGSVLHLTIPSGATIQSLGPAPVLQSAPSIQATDSITISARSWVPTTSTTTSTQQLLTANGAGFVVGAIYSLTPYLVTINPSATLVVTYTAEAASGIDQTKIRLYRWNATDNNWQPIPAQADLTNRRFTASVSQLGTYALGYDTMIPQVSMLAPTANSTVSNTLLIRALVGDSGTGVNPSTVHMSIDGQSVAASFYPATGELVYMPSPLLAAGPHTIQISAQDAAGNPITLTTPFTAEDTSYRNNVYMPIVKRSNSTGW